MKKKRIIYLLLSVLVVVAIFTFIFGLNASFSAYSSCRSLAMNAKGYAIWRHVSTTEDGSQSHVSFSDEYNNSLTCSATRMGPLWIATSYSRTLVDCNPSLGNSFDPCPEDYYGVEP